MLKPEKGIYWNLQLKQQDTELLWAKSSLRWKSVFGRYKAQIKSFSGVYSKEIKKDENFEKAKQLADEFAKLEGRRPRIMIAKMGQDGHDRGAKVVATGYADVGFDVDIGPFFQTPAEAAKQAVENDVHIFGVSSSWLPGIKLWCHR